MEGTQIEKSDNSNCHTAGLWALLCPSKHCAFLPRSEGVCHAGAAGRQPHSVNLALCSGGASVIYWRLQHVLDEALSRGIVFMSLSKMSTTSSKFGRRSGLGSQHRVTSFLNVCVPGTKSRYKLLSSICFEYSSAAHSQLQCTRADHYPVQIPVCVNLGV